ncbi:MAG: hypothetical protein K2W96_07790 [Gemmataceae bacterium]|nr:hypothetical protein [Gemmataceae bacterium]
MSRPRFAALALLALLGPALSQDDPKDETPPAPAGNWKLLMLDEDGAFSTSWLLRFEKKGDDWEGAALAKSGGKADATVEKVAVSKGVLRFTLKRKSSPLPCEIRLGDDPKADKLRGTALLKRNPSPVELHRTALDSLDPFDLAKETLAKDPPGFPIVRQALYLLQNAEEKEAKPAEVRAWAEKAVRSAELYGPAFQRDLLVMVATGLGRQKPYEAIALQYARRAERSLEGKEPPDVQKRVLSTLAALLEKDAKKKDEAKAVQARIAKLDFRIKPVEYKGRKGKSDRVVLVEAFTGSQDPSFAALGLALDAVARSYKPTEVVALRYHQHVPDPDPLANEDGNGRLGVYAGMRRVAIPLVILDASQSRQPAGPADEAPEVYEELLPAIDARLEKEAEARIALKAVRKGDTVSITAEVSGLPKGEEEPEARLVVALVEDGVEYKGGSGRPRHDGVVRHLPAGAEGKALKEKGGKHEFTVDLAKLKKDLAKYLKEFEEKRPFPDKERPMELKSLRVVAWVQGKTVMQAAVVPVADGKE